VVWLRKKYDETADVKLALLTARPLKDGARDANDECAEFSGLASVRTTLTEDSTVGRYTDGSGWPVSQGWTRASRAVSLSSGLKASIALVRWRAPGLMCCQRERGKGILWAELRALKTASGVRALKGKRPVRATWRMTPRPQTSIGNE
jgi:hypothetical protein